MPKQPAFVESRKIIGVFLFWGDWNFLIFSRRSSGPVDPSRRISLTPSREYCDERFSIMFRDFSDWLKISSFSVLGMTLGTGCIKRKKKCEINGGKNNHHHDYFQEFRE